MTRKQAMAAVRKILVDNFDTGFAIASWEEGGTTYHMETKFGNHYAAENLAERASEILFPPEEEETENA